MGIFPSDRPTLPGWPLVGEGPVKTLYLLHGFSGNCKDWISGSMIQELAMKYNVAVFMPDGNNRFYIDDPDMGEYYTRFIGEELVAFTRNMFPISHEKDDTFIGGFSMGGYGALRTGLLYPHTFGKILPISSALITKEIAGMAKDFKGPMADYSYYRRVFGDLDTILKSDRNPEVLIQHLIDTNNQVPHLFIACGNDDFVLSHNKDFVDYLKLKEIAHRYLELPGNHDWTFVNSVLEDGVKWLVEVD